MGEATNRAGSDEIRMTAPAAVASGELLQLPDGRVGFYAGLAAAEAGDAITVKVQGAVDLAKTTGICLLHGGRAFWDRSASKVHFKPGAAGDFYAGVVVDDAASADTTVRVALNEKPALLIDFNGAVDSECLWTAAATDGLGVTEATLSTPTKLAFDNTAEVAMAALYPASAAQHAQVADGPIVEMQVAVYDKGDDAALDINWGLANGTHATDADAITESVFFHVDGNATTLSAESDDGTTEVAATDTTLEAADDTFNEYWIDARNPADVKLYVDGVRVLDDETFVLSAATGPVFPIVHMEKTANDTTADVRVKSIRLRTCDFAA